MTRRWSSFALGTALGAALLAACAGQGEPAPGLSPAAGAAGQLDAAGASPGGSAGAPAQAGAGTGGTGGATAGGAGGGVGQGGAEGATCQDSDESFVQRASVAVLGHRATGYDEVRWLVDVMHHADAADPAAAPRAGRAAVVEALVRRSGGADYTRRWSDALADALRIARVEELANSGCFGDVLAGASPDLAALVRDQPPWPWYGRYPAFTLRDLFPSALQLDDVTPLLIATPMATMARTFLGANADPDELELARRAAVGSWFSGVYLRRDPVCLACHNGEASVTYSDDPALNRHFPVRTDLESVLFDSPAGPASLDGHDGAARLAAPFRFDGFRIPYQSTEKSARPWGWSAACGSFRPPNAVTFDVAPVDAALGSVAGPERSVWDVVHALQRGFRRLRTHGLAVEGGQLTDRDEALAYLAALSLAEAVWTEVTGGHLTVAHGFPRNEAARDRLASLTETLLASGGSLRALLVAIVSDPIFNALPPSAGCGEVPAPWPPVLDPWTVAESDPGLRGNGPGDLVAPLSSRTLVHNAYFALGWDTMPEARTLYFPKSQPQLDFLADVGTPQTMSELGFRGFDAQAALTWEQRFGSCRRPDALARDALDTLADTALATPDATLRDALIALKDRFTGERFLDAASEAGLIELLTGQPLATPVAAMPRSDLDRALRLVCGVVVASPQMRLSGLDRSVGPAPLLPPAPGEAYGDFCQPLAGQPLGPWTVSCP